MKDGVSKMPSGLRRGERVGPHFHDEAPCNSSQMVGSQEIKRQLKQRHFNSNSQL
jgi:hypothetical protein